MQREGFSCVKAPEISQCVNRRPNDPTTLSKCHSLLLKMCVYAPKCEWGGKKTIEKVSIRTFLSFTPPFLLLDQACLMAVVDMVCCGSHQWAELQLWPLPVSARQEKQNKIKRDLCSFSQSLLCPLESIVASIKANKMLWHVLESISSTSKMWLNGIGRN